MEVLPRFTLVRAATVNDVVAARMADPGGSLLCGGTDLMVNMRRGVVAPSSLIDVARVQEMRDVAGGAEAIDIGASATLAEIADHPEILRRLPALAQAARSVAGPTQRNMGSVGGNLCLDTRCVYYNQSEWWRDALNHCLKTTGDICHVAPKSKGVCYATYSGDLAPAFLIYDAQVELAGPLGRRWTPLRELYIGYAAHGPRPDERDGDGKRFLALGPLEFIVRVRVAWPTLSSAAFDKFRIRRSIEYPAASVAVALSREGDRLAALRVAFSGVNPRPVLLEGTAGVCNGRFGEPARRALDALVRDQLMSMKTTLTPGHYRRRVAGVLAWRLTTRLFEEAGATNAD